MGRRVRKFDGPSGRGLWYRYGATLWPGFKGFRGFGLPLAGWFKGWWFALRAMRIKSALRDLLSVSYDMLPTGQGGGASHQRGKTPKWYLKYMTRCFFPHISRFPLRGSPAKRERVYGAEQRYDTLSFS